MYVVLGGFKTTEAVKDDIPVLKVCMSWRNLWEKSNESPT